MKYRYIATTSIILSIFSSSIFASEKRDEYGSPYSVQLELTIDSETKKPEKYRYIDAKISEHYAKWKGTRYKFGGASLSGIDCSAFIQIFFKEKFSKHLPRTTIEQRKLGVPVVKNNLTLGDLIFFTMSKDERHVGVYIGNGQFMHASSSQGVTISRLNTPYWQQRYHQSRRIVI
nr:NlpC/P60 family protein [Serratia proteamaculans]